MVSAVATNIITPRLRRQLESLDWDFPEHLPGTSEAIHWYPGTFPASLPATLIQALSQPDGLVLDPYGGIGTTAAEALRQRRKAWLVEQNPVGLITSYVIGGLILLKSIDKNELVKAFNDLREQVLSSSKHPTAGRSLFPPSYTAINVDQILSELIQPTPGNMLKVFQKNPLWENLRPWIEQRTLVDIRTLYEKLSDTSHSNFGSLLGLTMLSANLRPACSQTRSWGHIADNVRPKEMVQKNIYQLCLRWIKRMSNMLTNASVVELDKSIVTQGPRYWVSLHNWQKNEQPNITPKPSPRCIITSPPYGDAIDYTLAQRLSLYLYGYAEEEIAELIQAEIGARRKRFAIASRETWAQQLVDSIDKQIQYLTDISSIALVLPHKDADRDIGPSSVESYLKTQGWDKVFETERSIRQIRARQSWTSIKKEIIQVYCKYV